MRRVFVMGSFVLASGFWVGCGAAAAGGASLLLGALTFAALLLSVERRANAGPPTICTGYEVPQCQSGWITKACCPAGSKCNFRSAPYVECGNGYCVDGKDRGRCVAPKPQVEPATDASQCNRGGTWQDACLDHRVQKACIASYPTNYGGPSHNPSWKTCMKNRCTTSALVEDCYPTKAELGAAACPGKWTPVCLGGKVEERCLPASANASEFPATRITTCKDGSCVVGDDRDACPQ